MTWLTAGNVPSPQGERERFSRKEFVDNLKSMQATHGTWAACRALPCGLAGVSV